MQLSELASQLEHTILRPELLPPQVHKAATDAMEHRLAGVVVAPVWVNRVATMLRGSGVSVCAAVGFPNGTNKSTVKAIEATSCLKDGADAIWVVPHLPNLIRCDLEATKFELLEIARAARGTRPQAAIHVVLSAQTEEMLVTSCQAVRESGGDGVVAGSDVAVIELIRRFAEGLYVTANGARDVESACSLIDAGADRVASEHAAEWVAGQK